MSNPKNAAEIVTDKDLDVVLKNTSFDSATFLRLYSEWKVTKDAHTFASLRKMHEDAGYNNKNLIFWAEQEMHEIAAIVQRYQAERNKVVSNTATATANTASTVWHAVTENNGAIPDVNPEKIKSLKTALENEANSPLTPDGLTKILERLKEEKNPDNRAVITSYIWSKMNHGGYITTIINDSISVEHVTDKIGATSLEKTLQAHISANILTLVDIQRAMIVGPESFRKYLNTQRVNIRSATTDGYVAFIMDARGINLTRATTLEQKLRIIQSSKATPDEKAFLVSYMNGGLRTYNIAPELDRQIKMDAIGAEIKASPEFKKTEKVVEVASGGAMKQEQDKREKDGKPKNLTLKELFDNPINAITTYPWSSVALIIGSIFAFGWKNTFMALLGVGIWMKAINEIADASGHPIGWWEKKETAKKGNSPKKSASKSPVNVPDPKTIDKSKMTDPQKAAVDKVEKDPQLTTMIASIRKAQATKWWVETADMADYIAFIHSDGMQKRKISELTNPQDFKFSIFSDEAFFDRANQNNLNTMMLKRIMRVYLWEPTSTDAPTSNQKKWEKEKMTFMAKHKTIFDDTKSTFADLTKAIYK
jgi:hypothetical protein